MRSFRRPDPWDTTLILLGVDPPPRRRWWRRRTWLDDVHEGVTETSPPLRDLLPPAGLFVARSPLLRDHGRHGSHSTAAVSLGYIPRHAAVGLLDGHRAGLRADTKQFAAIVLDNFGELVTGRGPVEARVADWVEAT